MNSKRIHASFFYSLSLAELPVQIIYHLSSDRWRVGFRKKLNNWRTPKHQKSLHKAPTFNEMHWYPNLFTHHYTSTALLAVNKKKLMREWITFYQWMWMNSGWNSFYIKGRNKRPLTHNTVTNCLSQIIHKLKLQVPRQTQCFVSRYPSRSMWRWHFVVKKMEKTNKLTKIIKMLKNKINKMLKKAPCTHYLLYRFWGRFIAL